MNRAKLLASALALPAVSAVADDQATVYVRWVMGTTDGSVTYPGWNIDDIQITGVAVPPPPPVCVGDIDGDNDADVFDFAIMAANFGTAVDPGKDGDLDGDGDVDVFDFGIFGPDFGCPGP